MGSLSKNTVYQINEYGINTNVILMYNIYNHNNSLAVSLYYNDLERDNDVYDYPFGDLYDVITVNLHESGHIPFGVQFVDVNNHPGIVDWLIQNKIAEPVPIYARSGFCVYPAVRFILTEEEKIKLQEARIDKEPSTLFS